MKWLPQATDDYERGLCADACKQDSGMVKGYDLDKLGKEA